MQRVASITTTLLPATAFSEIVLVEIFVRAVPGAQIAPTEIGGDDIDIICFFHDAEVDGDIRTKGIDMFEGLFFRRGIELILIGGEDIVHFGEMLFEGLNDVLYLPDKDPRIPEKVPAGEKGLSEFEIRLLRKGLHLVHIVRHRLLLMLDIAIAGIGVGGFDAEGDKGIMLIHESCERLPGKPW